MIMYYYINTYMCVVQICHPCVITNYGIYEKLIYNYVLHVEVDIMFTIFVGIEFINMCIHH